jgi:protein gp37
LGGGDSTTMRSAECEVFFKQWGGTDKRAAGRQYRGRTWDSFPIVDDRTELTD